MLTSIAGLVITNATGSTCLFQNAHSKFAAAVVARGIVEALARRGPICGQASLNNLCFNELLIFSTCRQLELFVLPRGVLRLQAAAGE